MKIIVIYRKISKEQIGAKAFLPFYESDKEDLRKFKDNTISIVDVKQPRNVKHHRKFFALCKILSQNTDIDIETAKEYIKLKTGYFYTVYFPDGSNMIKTKSIAFENMSQKKFEDFYEKALVIISEILQCTIQEIENNVIFEM